MAAIQNLCSKSILMSKGTLINYNDTASVVREYMKYTKAPIVEGGIFQSEKRKGNQTLQFTRGQIIQEGGAENVVFSLDRTKMRIFFQIDPTIVIRSCRIDIGINSSTDIRVAWFSTILLPDFKIENHHTMIEFDISNLNLTPDDYDCNLFCLINEEVADWLDHVMPFTISEKDYYNTGQIIPMNQGHIMLQFTHKLS
jgi:lipopolysaccharide transport system ATP-binding protein